LRQSRNFSRQISKVKIKTLKGAIEYLRSNRSLIALVFFSNYFYGLCAIALAIESALQFGYPLNSSLFYIFLFSITVLYYTKAYITEKKTGSANPRSQWYWEKRKLVYASQVLLTIIAAVYPAALLLRDVNYLLSLPWYDWGMLLVFPFVSGLYYGINHTRFGRISLRKVGWLKPFIIGFVWSGLVTVYPLVFFEIEKKVVYPIDWWGAFLFVKNFMFITVLCIMFDIKDYAADHNQQLKTFVVKAGLRNTIFFILIPLCIMGLASYVVYSFVRHFSAVRMLLNTIPFILLLMVAYSMHNRRSIFYYLIVIDGLMMVKALFGIVAMLF
jgi:hypothetical protein